MNNLKFIIYTKKLGFWADSDYCDWCRSSTVRDDALHMHTQD